MKRVIKYVLPLADVILTPAIYPAGYLLRATRGIGISRMPSCRRALIQIGVFPIRNHYYEPLFDSRALRRPLDQERELPGIDWNVDEQLGILKGFCFHEELKDIPRAKVDSLAYYFNNGIFGTGDAEYLYQLIRLRKPARLFEIGSGYSTLIAKEAIQKNQEEIRSYRCKHLCIEPYERPWLEATGVTVMRERAEAVNVAVFSELESGDILFIDSSHIIRPQGDVVFEYLELLPSLKEGVIVHVHDIFSPRDYPREWVVDRVFLCNEQYLLEAFLTCNRQWKVLGALNYLHHNHFERLQEKCPFLTRDREPSSFYIEKLPRVTKQ